MNAVTARTFDADGVPGGTWEQLELAVRASGLGMVLSESASHTPSNPSWHAFVPFADPFVFPSVAAWRNADAWLVGYFSQLAGFKGVGKDYEPAGRHGPACGLDLRSKSGNRATPVFAPSRRSLAAPPPKVVVIEGGALDLELFLTRTGFEAATASAVHGARPKNPLVMPASGKAGDPSVRVEDLHPGLLVWVKRYSGAFTSCSDRNRAALAIGGALGSRGISSQIAGRIAGALAASGADRRDRARVARYSARNAQRGTPTFGLPTIASLLGEQAAAQLEELLDDLILAGERHAD